MSLLPLGVHELGLKLFNSNIVENSNFPSLFWSYYPSSPRLIQPATIDTKAIDSALDTIQLQCDPYDLYSFFNGIHTLGYHFFLPNHFGTDWWNWNANYHQRGKKWEKPATISMKLANGEILNNVPLGIRINGNTSRAFPQKSFRLCFRDKYGKTDIPSPFINDSGRTYHTLVLRNHGANWGNLYSIDALVHNSIPRKDIVLLSKPVVLMLNNEFWGIYHLRSKLKFNAKEKESGRGVIKPSTTAYAKFCAELDTILTEKNDSLRYCQLDKYIDLNSLQYMVFIQLFFGNKDWPYDNVMIETGAHTPAKFYVKDLDLAFTKPVPIGGFSALYNSYQNVFIRLHNSLLQHPDYNFSFKSLVRNYFENQCFENSVASSKTILQPFSAQQSARWDRYSLEEIENYPTSVLDSFQMRKKRYLEYLKGV